MFRFLDSREIRGHSQIDLHRPIKREDFSFNGAAAEKPFTKATSFSNLGYVRLPEGALNLAWFQFWGGRKCRLCRLLL